MKKKEKKITMKYKGPVPCEIRRLGRFKPGDIRDIPESFARDLQRDRNWKRMDPPEKDSKKEPAADSKNQVKKGGK